MTYRRSTIRTVSSKVVAQANVGAACLIANVYTGATGAILKIYDGTDATGELIATIDASSKSSHAILQECSDGIFVDLSVGNADCAITHT